MTEILNDGSGVYDVACNMILIFPGRRMGALMVVGVFNKNRERTKFAAYLT